MLPATSGAADMARSRAISRQFMVSVTEGGWTALQCGAAAGFYGACRFLLARGADCEAGWAVAFDDTPVELALRHGHLQVAQLLVEALRCRRQRVRLLVLEAMHATRVHTHDCLVGTTTDVRGSEFGTAASTRASTHWSSVSTAQAARQRQTQTLQQRVEAGSRGHRGVRGSEGSGTPHCALCCSFYGQPHYDAEVLRVVFDMMGPLPANPTQTYQVG